MEVHSSPSGDLFYDPGQAPPLWYRPTAGVPAAQAVEHLFDLLSEFQERAGEDWRDEWVFPVWLSLSLFPAEEMATAQEDRLREIFKEAWAAAAQLKKSDPERYLQDQQRARTNLRSRQIKRYIYELDRTTGWSAGLRYVESHPLLLSDDAATLLNAWIRRSEAEGDAKVVKRLTQFQSLLERSRETGVAVAFAEAHATKLRPLFGEDLAEGAAALLMPKAPAEQIARIRNLILRTDPGKNLERWVTLEVELANALAQNVTPFQEVPRQDLEEALAIYERVLLFIDRKSQPLQWASTMSNLGNCRLILGEMEQAAQAYEQAHSAFEEAGRPADRAASDMRVVNLYFDRALQAAEERGRGGSGCANFISGSRPCQTARKREPFKRPRWRYGSVGRTHGIGRLTFWRATGAEGG